MEDLGSGGVEGRWKAAEDGEEEEGEEVEGEGEDRGGEKREEWPLEVASRMRVMWKSCCCCCCCWGGEEEGGGMGDVGDGVDVVGGVFGVAGDGKGIGRKE